MRAPGRVSSEGLEDVGVVVLRQALEDTGHEEQRKQREQQRGPEHGKRSNGNGNGDIFVASVESFSRADCPKES